MATANCSHVARGFYTKYDNSVGDLNVMGSLDKHDIWKILHYLADKLPNFEFLH